MHLDILSLKQKETLNQLSFTKEQGLYLAGGTALALQMGHRTSVDFGFYTTKHFKKGNLLKPFKDNLKGHKFTVLRDIDDTFEIQLNDIQLSCFYYQYPLISSLIDCQNVKIASIEDIAAMKIVAISQRGKRRDFIDIYYLIKKLGLAEILALTKKKYPELDQYNALRGLVYFNDADQDKEASRVETFEKISWLKTKRYIEERVKQLQKNTTR